MSAMSAGAKRERRRDIGRNEAEMSAGSTKRKSAAKTRQPLAAAKKRSAAKAASRKKATTAKKSARSRPSRTAAPTAAKKRPSKKAAVRPKAAAKKKSAPKKAASKTSLRKKAAAKKKTAVKKKAPVKKKIAATKKKAAPTKRVVVKKKTPARKKAAAVKARPKKVAAVKRKAVAVKKRSPVAKKKATSPKRASATKKSAAKKPSIAPPKAAAAGATTLEKKAVGGKKTGAVKRKAETKPAETAPAKPKVLRYARGETRKSAKSRVGTNGSSPRETPAVGHSPTAPKERMTVAAQQRAMAEEAFSRIAPALSSAAVAEPEPTSTPQHRGGPPNFHRSEFQIRFSQQDQLATAVRLSKSKKEAKAAAQALVEQFGQLPPDQAVLMRVLGLGDGELIEKALDELLELDGRGKVRQSPELLRAIRGIRSRSPAVKELVELLLEKLGAPKR